MKQKRVLIIAASSIAMVGIASCSNDDTAMTSPMGPSVEAFSYEYETLDSMAAETSILAGVALRSTGDGDESGDVEFVGDVTGSVTHNIGSVTVSDGIMEDQAITFNSGSDRIFSGSYEYVATFGGDYSSGGENYDLSGFAGIATRGREVPISGGASYVGEAYARIEDFGGNDADDLNYMEGNSGVNVDFSAGEVDVVMGGFMVRNGAGGPGTSAIVDSIEITGMDIAGNRFSGGTVRFFQNSSDLTLRQEVGIDVITGADPTSFAAGHFFGWNSEDLVPDEVAGGLHSEGDDASVIAGFIANSE